MNIWELKNQTSELIALFKEATTLEPNNQLLQQLAAKSIPLLENYLRELQKLR